jgi:hypothetical protein
MQVTIRRFPLPRPKLPAHLTIVEGSGDGHDGENDD